MKITIDLSEHSEKTRILIAKETSIISALSALAKDDCPSVQREAITNPNTSTEILTECAEELLEILNTNKDAYIWIGIVQNPNTPAEVLLQIYYKTNNVCTDEKEMNLIFRLLAKHRNTPPEILSKLAKYDNEDVKEAVAKNANTSTETLLKLAKESVGLYWTIEKMHPDILPRWTL